MRSLWKRCIFPHVLKNTFINVAPQVYPAANVGLRGWEKRKQTVSNVIIKNFTMPVCYDECPILDETGDYPMCRITRETRGYNFPVRDRRMDKCPLEPMNTQRSKGMNGISDDEFYDLCCQDCRSKIRCEKMLYWPDDCPRRIQQMILE